MSRLDWQIATVMAITSETERVNTYTLRLPQWTPHRAGQHYDLRLTAPDGYQTERSYSIASPPEQIGEIALTVEWISGGEVSGYLYEGVAVGDELEVRGPIGGYFVWPVDGVDAPLLLVAGGSGVVPLMAMLRHRQRAGLANPVVLLFSVRSPDEFIYQHELEALAQTDPTFTLLLTYTRRVPVGWVGYRRRLDAAMLAEARGYLSGPPQCYVCGPTGLVEEAATLLQAQGLPDNAIRTERFGPTGS
ncbi:oxidoreductase [Hymenobacter frigidus]|uniref:Oxidoreductase n=1 Tax=Hymenobacter frigidus TaxID=1524095 RepID=A0ABQ2ABS1_9BACT|nr:ferredoxin reductase [Hymenobacter frigidus]GGH88203.1 oxidoreductase [Hymenobacter frigidus]